MMARLAGPNTVPLAGGLSTVPAAAFYDDELGIGSIAPVDPFGQTSNYFVVQLDGTAGARGQTAAQPVLLDLSGEYEYALFAAAGSVWGFNKQTGDYTGNLIASHAGLARSAALPPAIRTSDRLIAFEGTAVTKAKLDGSDGGFVSEATLSSSGSASIPTASRTIDPNVVALVYNNGVVLFYDVVAKAEVVKPFRPHVGANSLGWYSRRFDVWITGTAAGMSDWAINVFANAVAPSTLATPTGTLVKGRVGTVTTRLLGASSEPCANELVDWSMTGDGALTAVQSTTDASGYATTGYVAPFTVVTDPTITASMSF